MEVKIKAILPMLFFATKSQGKTTATKTTKQAAAHNVSWGEKAKLDPCIFASCAWSMQEAGYSCRDLSLLSELKISSLSTWAYILRVNMGNCLKEGKKPSCNKFSLSTCSCFIMNWQHGWGRNGMGSLTCSDQVIKRSKKFSAASVIMYTGEGGIWLNKQPCHLLLTSFQAHYWCSISWVLTAWMPVRYDISG